jgi:hypothetical protein
VTANRAEGPAPNTLEMLTRFRRDRVLIDPFAAQDALHGFPLR